MRFAIFNTSATLELSLRLLNNLFSNQMDQIVLITNLAPSLPTWAAVPWSEPPVVVLPEGGDDDADHDVDCAEDGDGGAVVDAALPEVVMLARRRRGRDDEMHYLSSC